MAKGVEVACIKVTKEQALDAQFLLAKDTPVDTGAARSNWRISVGRPLSGKISAYSPYPSRHRPPYGPGGSKGESSNLAAVTRQGAGAMIRYEKGPIYISNNLRYIGPLDGGHSNQTTSGFITRAVEASLKKTAPKIRAIFEAELSK